MLKIRNVLVTDDIDAECVRLLERNGVAVFKDVTLAKDVNKLKMEISKYDGLIVRSATKVTEDVIAAGKKLRLIGRAGTGVDNIDCCAATRKGIIVMNTPGGNTLSAAEHTCAMLLAMTRHIATAARSMTEGSWDRKLFMGNEVYGKTLAILGLGKIGREVAFRMKAFGMKMIGFDPMVSKEEAAAFDVELLSLKEIWPRADFITIHTPLIPQTTNLINREVLAKCKKGVRIVNCARGGIIDEEALLESLKSGHCKGAALDVYAEEPPSNVALTQSATCTPHLGASTEEAQKRVAIEIAEQFVAANQGQELVGVVNMPSLANAFSPRHATWMVLATRLGRIAKSMLEDAPVSSVAFTTTGKSLASSGLFLMPAFLLGLQFNSSSNGINLVNAQAIAVEKGIKFEVLHIEGAESVMVHITTKMSTVKLVGSAVSGEPCLLSVGEYHFEPPASISSDYLMVAITENPTRMLSDVIGQLAAQDSQILVLHTSKMTAKGAKFASSMCLSRSASLKSSGDDLYFSVM